MLSCMHASKSSSLTPVLACINQQGEKAWKAASEGEPKAKENWERAKQAAREAASKPAGQPAIAMVGWRRLEGDWTSDTAVLQSLKHAKLKEEL